MKLYVLFVLCTILLYCGKKPPLGEEKWDNPHDPNSSSKKPQATKETETDSSSSSTSGNQAASYVEIEHTYNLLNPLKDDETGENVLLGAYMEGLDSILLVKDKVTNKTDGSQYYPLLELSAMENPTITQINLEKPESFTTGSIKQVIKHQNTLLALWGGNYIIGVVFRLVLYESTGTPQSIISFENTTNYDFTSFLFHLDTNLKIVRANSHHLVNIWTRMCDVDFNTENKVVNCIYEPESNFEHKEDAYSDYSFINGTYLSEYLYILYSGSSLYKFNMNLVYQKKYTISEIAISPAELKKSRLITDGQALYIVSLVSDTLKFRKLKLVE